MNKIHVDDILLSKKNSAEVGPGRYEPSKTFGNNGLFYSMKMKDRYPELHLDKSKKLPGPGFYQHPEILGKG